MLATAIVELTDQFVHKSDGNVVALTHINHPCTKWIRQHSYGFTFAYQLAVLCLAEHSRRFKRSLTDYKLMTQIEDIKRLATEYNLFTDDPVTTFPLAMPELLRQALHPGHKLGETPRVIDDVVKAVILYRVYYVNNKETGSRWTKADKPMWCVNHDLIKVMNWRDKPPF